jgi:hypothetical protein
MKKITSAPVVLAFLFGCKPPSEAPKTPVAQPSPESTAPQKIARVAGSKGSPQAPQIFVDAKFTPGTRLKVFQQGATPDAEEVEIAVIEVVESIENSSACRLLSGKPPAPGDVVRP